MVYNFQEGKEIARSMLEGYLQGKGINTSKPFCCLVPGHHDKHASMSMTKNKRQVHCFGACGQSYDIFDLIGFETGLEKFDLFKYVFEQYNIPVKDYTVESEKKIRPKNEASCFWITIKEASLIGLHLPGYQMTRRKRDVFGFVTENGLQVKEAVGKELLDLPDKGNPCFGFSAGFAASKQLPDENGEIQTLPCLPEDFNSDENNLHMTPFAMVKMQREYSNELRIGEDGLPLVETVSWKDFMDEDEFREMVFSKLHEKIVQLEAEANTGRINYFRFEINRIQRQHGLDIDCSETYQQLWDKISSMEHENDALLKELYALQKKLYQRQVGISKIKLKNQLFSKRA